MFSSTGCMHTHTYTSLEQIHSLNKYSLKLQCHITNYKTKQPKQEKPQPKKVFKNIWPENKQQIKLAVDQLVYQISSIEATENVFLSVSGTLVLTKPTNILMTLHAVGNQTVIHIAVEYHSNKHHVQTSLWCVCVQKS